MFDKDKDNLFWRQNGLDLTTVQRQIEAGLHGADDGELFLEATQNEMLSYEDQRLKISSFDSAQGFGLRAICGEKTGYAHCCEITPETIGQAINELGAVKAGHSGVFALPPSNPDALRKNAPLYGEENPVETIPFAQKIALLAEIDAYLRARDPKVRQVTVNLNNSWQAINILRPGSDQAFDIRPLTRLNISVLLRDGARQEIGSYGHGGRKGVGEYLTSPAWRQVADEALRIGFVNLAAQEAPAGEMAVVLGPGWPGILLHEAIGHGLEGDFNRKKCSAFSHLMGEKIAAKGINIVDDGTVEGARGSIAIDDEGTPSGRLSLIEDGVLKNYMQDRMNARLMGKPATGNGRRQSYAHAPMPRMTNTYMTNGPYDPQEILESVADGIYATSFGGGQVDIVSGKFVFSCTEAYKIKNGKIGAPVKGATLIGSGFESLCKISMVGNDMALDPGIGTCGKAGQWVPVGVGQPSLKIDAITVGGTAVS